MDSAITLPGVRRGVGLDALLGLVPIAGDTVSALIGLYSILQARELGASRWLQVRMVGNWWSTPHLAPCLSRETLSMSSFAHIAAISNSCNAN